MSNEASRRVRLVFGIVLSIALVAVGVCLMTACLGVYLTGGEQIFTPEKVALAFSKIAVPVYLCLTLVLIGFILDLFLPFKKAKLKAEKDPAVTLERLLGKRDVDSCDPALKEQILNLRKRRRAEKIITLAVLAVCSIVFLCYGANPANFHQSQINASMVKAVIILLACMAVPFAFALTTAYRAKKSLEKEIELVKQIDQIKEITTNKAISESSIRINKQNIGLCIFLSIFTGGIYLIYWKYLLLKNTRIIKNDSSSYIGELLCFLFVPFYSLYWWFTRGKNVKNDFSNLGYSSSGNGILYLLLSILGLEIVSMAIMQEDFNSLPLENAPSTCQPIVIARWALVIIAVAILVYGFFTGGTADVLTKAKNICTECVGLG